MNTANLATKLPKAASSYMLQVVEKYDIKNPLHLAHFLAQIAHESGNFQFVTENLNYSAEGLRKVFPKYFADNIIAMKYARKSEAIGSRVYANRMGNGDEASKEGFKFRGRGYIQLTGKSNYKAFSDFIKEDCVANPDLVATKYPMDSAIWFFDKNKLWDICAKGSGNDIVTAVTRRVNGGTNGLADRIAKFKLYYSLLQQA
jgi:putative chitinase